MNSEQYYDSDDVMCTKC